MFFSAQKQKKVLFLFFLKKSTSKRFFSEYVLPGNIKKIEIKKIYAILLLRIHLKTWKG